MISAPLDVGAVRRLAEDDDVMADMADFYDRLDHQIADHRPLCWNRGACCHFGKFDHRLFVTPLELAHFIRHTDEPVRRPTSDHCPYQHDGQCHARAARPMGCRIFHCEAVSQSWQGPLTENSLDSLRNRHDRLGVEYAYVDWINALEQLSAGPKPATVDSSSAES
jgi:hypothetical protein